MPNTGYARWGSALLLVAPAICLVAVYAVLGSFVEDTSTAKIEQQLHDLHDDEAIGYAGVVAQFLAGVVFICSGAYLAARLRDAPALALASLAFATSAAVLLAVAAGARVALLLVAESVADGDASSSTLLLGRTLAFSVNVPLSGALEAVGLWVAAASIAMLRTSIYSRWAAFAGIVACVFALLAQLGNAGVEALYGFSAIGFLLMVVWSVWLAVDTVRGGQPREAAMRVGQPAASLP